MDEVVESCLQENKDGERKALMEKITTLSGGIKISCLDNPDHCGVVESVSGKDPFLFQREIHLFLLLCGAES